MGEAPGAAVEAVQVKSKERAPEGGVTARLVGGLGPAGRSHDDHMTGQTHLCEFH